MELDLGTRRVQDYQGAALLCLPKTWTKSRGIVKGDRLHVVAQTDGSLRIEAPGIAWKTVCQEAAGTASGRAALQTAR